MSEPVCHYCDRAAEEQCPTCGRLYCGEHGDDVCLRCMAPESATPGSLMYRGSLLALVLASLVALFLFIRPPESKSANGSLHTAATATSATRPTATPTPPGTEATRSATANASVQATASVAGNTTPGATTPAGRTYTVVDGDTLSTIAAANNVTLEELQALNPGVTPENLRAGAVLRLP